MLVTYTISHSQAVFFCESRLKKTTGKNSTATLSSVNRDYVAQTKGLYSKWTAEPMIFSHCNNEKNVLSLPTGELTVTF